MADATKARRIAEDAPIDPAVIRELALILADTGLTEIEVERGDLRLRVAKEIPPQVVHAMAQPAAAAPVAAPPAAIAPPAAESAAAPANDAGAKPGAVASPMVGTAYLSPDPDSDRYIHVGDRVEEGQTLLLIEAMKTFNPIPASHGGVVREILVDNAEPVEFGQPLVVIA